MAPPREDPSPPWAIRLRAELADADRRASRVVESLTPTQLNQPPRPGAWSVGQCLQHIAMTNELYVAAMSEAISDRPRVVVPEITPGWFGRWFLRSVIAPSSTMRARAPRKIVPQEHVEPSVVTRFLDSNRAAGELIARAAAVDINRARFRNPFVPLLRFTVGTGLEILSQHQQRHLLQAERARAAVVG